MREGLRGEAAGVGVRIARKEKIVKGSALRIASVLVTFVCLAATGARAEEGDVRVPLSAGGAAAPAAEGGPAPEISFITSDNPGCHQPDPALDRCLITFSRLWVDAAPNYMIRLTLELNGRLVARYGGFFQTGMDIGATAFGQGITVPCGRGGQGGVPGLGRKYNFIIRAEDSASLKAANYGAIHCPPFRGPLPVAP